MKTLARLCPFLPPAPRDRWGSSGVPPSASLQPSPCPWGRESPARAGEGFLSLHGFQFQAAPRQQFPLLLKNKQGGTCSPPDLRGTASSHAFFSLYFFVFLFCFLLSFFFSFFVFNQLLTRAVGKQELESPSQPAPRCSHFLL